MASGMDVPTLPDAVRTALRELRCPVRLFGENLANVRDRLRLEKAKRQVYAEHYGTTDGIAPTATSATATTATTTTTVSARHPEETQYTNAPPALVVAREKISMFSLQRSRVRLERERKVRMSYKELAAKKRKSTTTTVTNENDDTSNTNEKSNGVLTVIAEEYDRLCCDMYQSFQDATLAGSQYGDVRPLSAITATGQAGINAANQAPRIFTASWSATLQWWDGSSPTLDLMGRQRQAHEDRIMGVALRQQRQQEQDKNIMAGTASIDLTAKLWTISEKDTTMTKNNGDMDEMDAAPTTSTTVNTTAARQEDEDDEALPVQFTQVAHLKGHKARLCRIAFHPQGDYVATTSHDYTWRLWNIETCCNNNDGSTTELLLQDGHAREVFGIDFHPDGSLVATTDYSGMIHLWDLRTGKTVIQYYGHAGRVLCAKFAPVNGFQLTTAGDDGCLKVWDLRHRRKTAKTNGAPEPRRTIPAHSKLISHLEYSDNDECLVSSSFDGTAKIWSTRGDWKMLRTLEGHEGKVMGLGIVSTYNDAITTKQSDSGVRSPARDWGVVTCGYDKTLKLWK